MSLDKINPIEAITAEMEKLLKQPDKIGIMSVKSANQWVDDALEEPDPKHYFYDLLVEGECTVLFASSNAGKSILATHPDGRSRRPGEHRSLPGLRTLRKAVPDALRRGERPPDHPPLP